MNAATTDLAITLDDAELDFVAAGIPPGDQAELLIRLLAAWRTEKTGGLTCELHY